LKKSNQNPRTYKEEEKFIKKGIYTKDLKDNEKNKPVVIPEVKKTFEKNKWIELENSDSESDSDGEIERTREMVN